jgi:FtsP/CotA-like multicopper oxidase with cupredoxin domain
MRTQAVELEARETDWEYAPGRSLPGMGFNGSFPGPLIEAEVGDTIRARLTNSLSQRTTIHWHGLRVPASMDGTESVQSGVEPGTSFDYEFSVPDAGTFWYHTHVNETEQLERGLYGPLVVRGPGEPKLDAERVLMLDDLKLDDEGHLSPFGDDHELHEGREGDVRLVNGRQEPELEIAAGQVERWRVVNAANTRFVRLSIGGRPFSILGSDGGLIGAPVEATEVLVTPGERVELAVGPFAEREELELEALPYDRGRGEPRRERFATIRVGPARTSSAHLPSVLREITPLAGEGAEPTRTVSMKALMHGGHGQRDDDVRVGPARASSAHLPAVLREITPLAGEGAEPTRTVSMKALMHGGHGQRDDDVRVGELQVWDLVNETSQDHPFHLHGFFFQVLSDGEGLGWKDTVNVPQKAQVRIAWLADDRPGEWMYHCHILEHHAMGMMAHFRVVT